MTAIAASLVVVLALQTRTSRLGPSAAIAPVYRAAAKHAVEPTKSGNVLITRDAHLQDIELRLIRRELRPTETGDAVSLTIEQKRSILTPTAWNQAIDATQLSHPSTDDASGLFRTNGANS